MTKKKYSFFDISKFDPGLSTPTKPTEEIDLRTFKPGELKKSPEGYGIDGPVKIEKRFEMVCDDEAKNRKGRSEHNKFSTAILFGKDNDFGTVKLTGGIGKSARGWGVNKFSTLTSAESDLNNKIIKKITRRRSGCTYPSSPAEQYMFSAEDAGVLEKYLPVVVLVGLGILGYKMFMKRFG